VIENIDENHYFELFVRFASMLAWVSRVRIGCSYVQSTLNSFIESFWVLYSQSDARLTYDIFDCNLSKPRKRNYPLFVAFLWLDFIESLWCQVWRTEAFSVVSERRIQEVVVNLGDVLHVLPFPCLLNSLTIQYCHPVWCDWLLLWVTDLNWFQIHIHEHIV
jgi:hypothetical protein